MKTKIAILLAGGLLQTARGFAQAPQWRELPNAPARSGRHEDVFFVNPRLGWIVNGAGEIHKTGDGGKSWQLQWDVPYYLRSVAFTDSLAGWVGSLSSEHVLYATKDGGLSWAEITDLPALRPMGICGMSAANDSVIYAAGRYDGPARMIKTTNKGKSWSAIDLSVHARGLVDCHFWSPDSGLVVGATGRTFESQTAVILFTSDGGATWARKYQGTRTAELCWKISFASRQTGYVSIEAFHQGPIFALKTTDGGMTWTEKKVADGPHDMQGIGFATATLGWIGGRNPTYETTDGGETWRQTSFGFSLNRFRMLSDTLGYAVGRTVYKYSTETTNGVAARAHEQPPADFRLEQNFPNPFNPATHIRYILPKTEKIAVRIYDTAGREVRTLFEGERAAGVYSHLWDGRDHGGREAGSGVYLVRLEGEKQADNRKMILIR